MSTNLSAMLTNIPPTISINGVGDESLLSRLEESRQGALNLLLVCSVELLGRSDDADNLATVRCHQSVKRGHHS